MPVKMFGVCVILLYYRYLGAEKTNHPDIQNNLDHGQ